MEKVKRGLLHKLLMFPGMFLIWSFNKLVVLFGKDVDIIETENIPFNFFLEDNYEPIKAEFENVFHARSLTDIEDFYKVDTDIGIDDQWKAFPLIIWNHAFNKNLELCPRTYQVIQKIPGCTSAMFSVLLPGKHIFPHKGVYKGVIRCLFTLHVKEGGDCWIKINGKKNYFQAGKPIYFDEVFEHEVVNNTDEIRAVFYFDIYRKLASPLNIFNRLLFHLFSNSPYMQTIINEYQKLNRTTIEKYKPKKPISL